MIEGSPDTTLPSRPAGRSSAAPGRWLVLLLGGLALVPPALVACGTADDPQTPTCPSTPGAYGSSTECFTQPGSAATKITVSGNAGAGGDTGAGGAGDGGSGGEGGAGDGGAAGAAGEAGAGGG